MTTAQSILTILAVVLGTMTTRFLPFFIFVIMPDRSPAFLLDFLWYALRHKR